MNAEQLLAHYERMAEASDAIARLRRFVLDLAVRGKLVEQDPADEPAPKLLQRIASQRSHLIETGAVRRSKTSTQDMVAAPFALPDTWTWASLGSIFLYDAGAKREPKSLLASRWLLELEDVEKDTGRLLARMRVSDRKSQSTKSEFQVGDILYGKLRPYLNKVLTADEHGYSTTEIVAIRPFLPLCSAYCAIALRRPDFVDYVSRLGQGTKMPRLRTEDAVVAAFPLPPLAEQHRIVAKVDELMALCDRLEEARKERDAARDRLTAASLARLNAPDPDPATCTTHARFALDNFLALTNRASQIEQLRQTILNLAVLGKLVDQIADDETGAVLLERISAERDQLSRTGKIPRLKAVNRDAEFAKDALPASWLEIGLGDVCNFVTSGSRGWGQYYAESGPGFVRAQNIRFGKLRLEDLASVNPPKNSEGSRTQLEMNDILVVITGAGVTNPALLDRDLGEAYVSQHVGLVRPTDKNLAPWLLLCLMADAGGRAELTARAYGAGKPGLNLDNIRSLTIPLPPLVEQHRIVAKVEELMALCDQLESSLATGDEIRQRMLEAVLHETLEPAEVRELEAA